LKIFGVHDATRTVDLLSKTMKIVRRRRRYQAASRVSFANALGTTRSTFAALLISYQPNFDRQQPTDEAPEWDELLLPGWVSLLE
jgi:hypothetical protein